MTTRIAEMRGTASVAASEELACVTRNGFVESRHAGSAVVLGTDGAVLRSLGDPEATIFTRSALKPLQSLAMHSAGLQLQDTQEMALSMASHGGSVGHLALVQRMLSTANLSEDQLLCPADWPMDNTAREEVLARGGQRRRLAMCCSGKHAAMLLTCVQNGWSIADYIAPEHPLQVLIRETVQRFTGEKPSALGVDGCGAPVLGISLLGLARGLRRMATAEIGSPFPLHRTAATLIAAAKEHPWVVEGPGRADTVTMERLGLFSKFGAEGIVIMSTDSGVTVAVKILDGNARAAHAVALELLVEQGELVREDVDAVLQELRLTVYGGGAPVGSVVASFAAAAEAPRHGL